MTKYERYYADKSVAYKYRLFDNCEYTLNLLEKGEVFFICPKLSSIKFKLLMKIKDLEIKKARRSVPA